MARHRPSLGKTARNERRKALATTMNAVSVAGLIGAIIQPMILGHMDPVQVNRAVGVFIVLQALMHYVLARLED